MSAAGIGDDDLVVAYDADRGSHAGRLWWMLRATGHAVALLDGGLQAWEGPIETGPPAKHAPATFTATACLPAMIASIDEVRDGLRAGDVVVLDARAGERSEARSSRSTPSPVTSPAPATSPGPTTSTASPGASCRRSGSAPDTRAPAPRRPRPRWCNAGQA
jgi:thiosulfate/3-mercaptopyruvate sulfurtransferase